MFTPISILLRKYHLNVAQAMKVASWFGVPDTPSTILQFIQERRVSLSDDQTSVCQATRATICHMYTAGPEIRLILGISPSPPSVTF